MNGDAFSIVGMPVQELSNNCHEPLPRFVVKDQCNHSSLPFADIPVIDLRLLSGSSESKTELIKLRSALSSWGYFQAIGHEISSSFLDNVRDVVKEFYALPVEEKNQYAGKVGDMEGYKNDYIFTEKETLNWSDCMIIRVHPECIRKLNLWPKNPTSFKEVTHEFTNKMETMFIFLAKAIARSLNLEEDSFLSMFGEQATIFARFNFYPVCSKPNHVLGAKAHTDGSGITILLLDKEVQGLQVFREDKWYRVPIVSDALLVNVGDQLEIMSNGILKSPLHRVAVNSEQERISIAAFYEPEAENEIGPIEELISEEHPRMYRNVRNFLALTFESYQSGKMNNGEFKCSCLIRGIVVLGE